MRSKGRGGLQAPASKSSPKPPPLVVGVDELARLLDLDRKSVYAAVRRGEIPHRKIGRKILFARSVIDRWLAGGTQP